MAEWAIIEHAVCVSRKSAPGVLFAIIPACPGGTFIKENTMPYIATTANISISSRRKETIKERMGKAIELIPGKSEDWLMLSFRDNVSMFFRGEDEPCAICQVKLFGTADDQNYADLTEALTDIIREELDIEPDRIYITYDEVNIWGWNGGNL